MGEEARTGKRFPLELPIKIHKGDTGDAKGVTGNLSAAGVYIRADAAMEIGSPVEFEITLPPEMTGGQENVTIQCKGRVVRADETGQGGEGRGVQTGGGARPSVVPAQGRQLQQFAHGGPLLALEECRPARVEGEQAFAEL